MIPINADFQLECPECGNNKFLIGLSENYTRIICTECGTTSYYKQGEAIINPDLKNYVPTNQGSTDYFDC